MPLTGSCINDLDETTAQWVCPLTLDTIEDATMAVCIEQGDGKRVVYDAQTLYTHCVSTRVLPPQDPMTKRAFTEHEQRRIAGAARQLPLAEALVGRRAEIELEKQADVLSEELGTELAKQCKSVAAKVSRIWQRRVGALTQMAMPAAWHAARNVMLFDRENGEDALQAIVDAVEKNIVCDDDGHMVRGFMGEKYEALLKCMESESPLTAVETVTRIQSNDRVLAERLTQLSGLNLMALGNGDD